MTSNYIRFNEAIVLEISGRDAARYLQSRLTNDIGLLDNQESILSACLSPQGKTESLFVISKNQEKFLLFATAGNKENIIAALKKFIVADQVEVKDLSDEYTVCHFLDEKIPVDVNALTTYKFDRYGSPGTEVILKREEVQKINAEAYPENSVTLLRIQSEKPDFPFEIKPDSLFAEAALEEAISRTKGCYAGQEVIERVSALGKLPAVLMSFKIAEQFATSETVEVLTADSKTAGSVVSYATEMNSTYLFVRIRSNFKDEELFLNIQDRKVKLEVISLS